ncbi:MAG: amidohydrolase family protein [Cryomorphaceae bacterium]|nr:amidohydrolase family protein [Cryomorphaceae bacterium]MBT5937066.1 amidohydrolase family protein [Cryomorphaceae bacterium]MBT6317507.1 amidohydrolase family protein [Cryomorphaceae bacterium]
MKRLILLSIIFSSGLYSQDYFIVNDGVKTKNYEYNVFINANIYSSDGIINNASLVVKDGKIQEIGQNLSYPDNSIIHDLNGQYIYPSFVEIHSSLGVKKPQRSSFARSSQYEPKRNGYYWNDHILSDYNSFNDYKYDQREAKSLRDIGFGVVNSHNSDGVHRGTSFTIGLIDDQNESYRVISEKTAEHFSFTRSLKSNQSYPSSTMGAIALIRQLYYDTEWYSQGNSETKDLAIEALMENKELPKLFDANDKLNVYRAAKLSSEFDLNFIIKGSGKEYENVRELKQFDNTLIIPVNFPKAFNVSNSQLNEKLNINQLRYWSQAPANLSILEKNGINFTITSSDLKNKRDFLENIRKAIKFGLTEKKALEALTIIPAKSINLENKIGKLDKGYLANFLITSGPLFDDKTVINENWVKGQRHLIKRTDKINFDGHYNININDNNYKIEVSNSLVKPKTKIKRDSINIKSKSSLVDDWFNLTIFDSIDSNLSLAQITSKIITSDELNGSGINFNNSRFSFSSKNEKNEKEKQIQKNSFSKPKISKVSNVTYPNVGFGFDNLPNTQSIHFKNATLWTNEKEGIVKNTDIIIDDGKIISIGKNLNTPENFKVIDVNKKHITSGIIDEHSHMGASSINEGGHNSSAEVSIMDVINPDDINIYRNLAGGVTTVQVLHGSANPIGGQSAIIKLRWGSKIDDMFFKGADPFIKFALGENVKQSNWSGSRFPQTRMGVEQVFIDHFDRAKEYGDKWTKYNSLSKRQKSSTNKPRFDEELETLWEILRGDRFVSSHSYIQSEINMLMKVAERFNFRINTFTHILEGYKVADKMKEHGVGASTFSDWWGYKYEVNDAIPYNAAIMHNAGVTVALNSDSSELSRRLNLEAAKAVKYGGISEEEAWKFVTLNPAKLLHLDDKVGSLKVGKDADIVIWSGHPMSLYTKVEQTYIEGGLYFDQEEHKNKIEEIQKEKTDLIKLMFEDDTQGGSLNYPNPRAQTEVNCETTEF